MEKVEYWIFASQQLVIFTSEVWNFFKFSIFFCQPYVCVQYKIDPNFHDILPYTVT